MSPRGHSYVASDRSILCAALRPEGPSFRVNSFFSIVCRADGGIFIPIFRLPRKEMAAMTMPKRETNSIWARVRDDVDIDDLIFNYEAYHSSEDDVSTDR